MTSWKESIQVQDLGDDQRLELICTKCNRLTYTTREEIWQSRFRTTLFG